MKNDISENTAIKLIEIFSKYEDDFDLSTRKGRESLYKHLIEKFKTGDVSIRDGAILGFFNEGFSEESPKIIFNKKSFVDSEVERKRIQSKIESYLKIGEIVEGKEVQRPKKAVSANTVVSNYCTLKSRLIEMDQTIDSPLSFMGRGDFTKNLPQKGKYRGGAINAISSIARGISSNLETMFIDVNDRQKFLDTFSWVGELKSARWNERIKLAGKSAQDWLGTHVKLPGISEAVSPSLHFQTLQKGLSVVQDPEIERFLYLKFFIPTRAVQFKDLVYGKESGLTPYYDPETKMIVFESDPDVIDEDTGVRGSKTLGKKHYFNFIVSDHLDEFFKRMHQNNLKSGLVGGNKPLALFPTLYKDRSSNTRIIREIRRKGGLFDLTNTPAYRKKWQRGGINNVLDLRKWSYSFYETHFSGNNKRYAKGLDQSMGHKITSKQVGARYGGKNAIKDTWGMTEFSEVSTKLEQEMLNSFKDIYADKLPSTFKITTGDLPSIFLVKTSTLFDSDNFELNVEDWKSSEIGIQTSGSEIAQRIDRSVLRQTIETELRSTSLQTSEYLRTLNTLSEQTGESPDDLYKGIINKISEDNLTQDKIIGAFEEKLSALQKDTVAETLQASNISGQAIEMQQAGTSQTVEKEPISQSTVQADPLQPVEEAVTSSTVQKEPIPQSTVQADPLLETKAKRKRVNWASKAVRGLRTVKGIKKAALFVASGLTPYQLLTDYAAEAAVIEAFEAGRDIIDPELSELDENLGGLERIDPTQYDSPYFERAEEEASLGVDDDPDFRFGIPSEGRFDELHQLRRLGLRLQKYRFTDKPRSLEEYRGHMGDIPRISDETYDPEREKLIEHYTGIKHFGPKLQNIAGDEDRFLAEAQDAAEQGRLSDTQKEYLKQIQDKYGRGTELDYKLQRKGKQFPEEGDFKTLAEEQRDKSERALSTNQQFKQLFDLPT